MPTQRRMTLDEGEDYVNCLYYGSPGTGKTTDAASLAKLGKTVAVNAEGGFKKRPLVDLGVPVQNIQIFDIITYDSLDKLFWELKEEVDHEGDDQVTGVVVDSLSEVHKILLGHARERAVERTRAKGKEREDFDTYVEDYGINTGEMRHLCRQFRDLKCHVGFTALPRRDQDDDGAIKYGPDLTPKLMEDVLGYMDIICHTEAVGVRGAEEPQYWGQFRPVGKWQAKDRFHALPPRLVNPTMDRIIAYVKGELTVEDDTEQQEALEELKKGVIETGGEDEAPKPKLANRK